MSISGKIALVTGATRDNGIGQAIALELGRAGNVVVATSMSEKGADKISEMLQKASIAGSGVVLDVTSTASIEKALGFIIETYGAPQILVNNAGATSDNLFLRMKEEEWSRIIGINLTGTYRLTHACLRHMVKERWGRIINIASVVGVAGNAGQANYAAAKAGIIGLTKSLALEVGTRGVTVNSVAPGLVDTEMTRSLSSEQKTKLLEQIPTQRAGEPSEIAYAVSFLASPRAGYITGETLHVNGGMYMC